MPCQERQGSNRSRSSFEIEVAPYSPIDSTADSDDCDLGRLAGICDDLRKFKDEGTELDEAKLAENIEDSEMMVTALSPVVSYDKAAKAPEAMAAPRSSRIARASRAFSSASRVWKVTR